MAMTDGKIPIFIDTNVLIRTHVETAPEHQTIREVIKQLILNEYEIWISRQVLREYSSVLTREQPYTKPIAPPLVSAQIRLFETGYRIADENSQVTAALCTLMDTVLMGGKQIHDANIVATMQVYGILRLLTLNPSDFNRFAKYITVVTPMDVVNNRL
jgi:predicted nucleic acid-binding protein